MCAHPGDGGQQLDLPLKGPDVLGDPGIETLLHGGGLVDWREDGVEGLRSKGSSGRSSRMKPEWRAWLASGLEKGPAAHGWTEDQRWT
ncbi:hypothetical protein ACFV4J_57935, partial [Streptomyces mirabilis]